MSGGGFGAMDFMIKSYKNNRALLKSRKPLKELYNELNYSNAKNPLVVSAKYTDEKRAIFRRKLKIEARKLLIKKLLVLFAIIGGLVFLVIHNFMNL